MKPIHWLWAILLALLLVTVPSLYERWTVEVNQNEYELVLPYDHVEGMAEDKDVTKVLQSLEDAGLTTVMVSPDENGYPEKSIQKVEATQLDVMLSLGNDESADQQNLLNAISNYYHSEEDYVHIEGSAVPGYPDKEQMNSYAETLSSGEEGIYVTEFYHLKGIKPFSEDLDYNVIRLHDLDSLHGHQTVEQKVDRTIRAIKVRNQRSILLASKEVDSLEHTLDYLTAVTEAMPENFKLGEAEGFKTYEPPAWAIAAALVAGLIFLFFSIETVLRDRRALFLLLLPFALAFGYFLTDNLLFLQAFSLIVALATPIFAVKKTASPATSIKQVTGKYAIGLGINMVGILIIISLLNGTMFLTGIELFRGVKLVYLVPILFFIVYSLWGLSVKDVLSNIKWWHILILLLIGAAGAYYVLRSGNSTMVSDWELLFRQKLEEWLYVRPRTKEFLLGFPAYLLAIHVMASHKRIGMLLLVPGVIGFMSMVNTFTHLHIPLYVSLIRTGYSIVLGYIIGLLCIALFNLIFKPKRKWS